MKRWLVVGGGAAGCVVAARIKQRTGDLVTLVEAGRDHPDGPADGPVLDDPVRLWGDCRVVRRPGLAPEPYPQGYGLGGSSLVNGAVATVDPADDGVEHMMPLDTPDLPGVLGAAVLAASDRASPVRLVRRDGRRVTTADAYLRPLRGRVEHLYVRTGTRVRRLALDGRRVIGAVSTAGEELEAEHTVLCAGAIHTPALMLRSGIDTPDIGEGVQDHPSTTIRLALPPAAARDGAPSITVAVDGDGWQITAVNHMPGDASTGALLPALMRVASRGRVTLPDPDGPPLVELHQLTAPEDRTGLVAAVRQALALLEHPALANVVEAAEVGVSEPVPAARLATLDDAALGEWLEGNLGGYYHLAASCRMGVVTDDLGHVRGYEGLSICDASLFPGVPPVGPYLQVVALAERLTARWAA